MTVWENTEISLVKHDCLTDRNPVIQNLRQGQGIDAVPAIFAQYYCLVRIIVQFLASAADRLSDWHEVRTELRRNLGEETGSRTRGQLHQTILRKLLKSELGWDVVGARWNQDTTKFLLDRLLDNFWHNPSQSFVAGMIYAIEASARPELLCIAEILNLSVSVRGDYIRINLITDPNKIAEWKKANQDWSLEFFLGIHVVDFEIGHATRLEDALRRVDMDLDEFEKGYEFVLDAMDIWWVALSTLKTEKS